MFKKFSLAVKKIKGKVITLYLVYQHKGVAWYKKAFIVLVIAYALSPIDLIPDFIPVLGMLDDFIIIPLGVLLAIKIIPKDIWEACEQKATEGVVIDKKYKIIGAVIIASIWVIILITIIGSLI